MIINHPPKVMIMSIELPPSVSTFFAVSNGDDVSGLRGCLAADAVVYDEGRVHQGYQAIQAWLQDAQRQYRFRSEPLEAHCEDARLTVVASVSGDFPGSPLRLAHVFRMAGEAIQSVEIG